MIKADWNIFKAKFSDNPQTNFEWLVYSLFCREFNLKTGIFRYKNQRGIETELIKFNEDYIGWQAKYYETSLSDHKDDFLKMLENTKESYPEINKLIVFSNAEWGQSKGKPPAGKLAVEKYAAQLNIELEWRCQSYFETPDVITKNLDIYGHFFSLSQSIYEKLERLRKHSERLTNRVSSYISYDQKKISIDRTGIKDLLLSSSNQIVLLTGQGGVGKSALIKEIYDHKNVEDEYYIHIATEFEVSKVEDFLCGIKVEEFIRLHENVSTKVVIIDSSESLLGIKNLEPFKEYLEALINANWKIWFTTRDQYLEDISFDLIESYKLAYEEIKVPQLTRRELIQIATENKIELPQDEKLKDLLTNLFYLNEYLKFHEDNIHLDYRKFRDSLWPKVISKKNPVRSEALIEIAKKRANTGQFLISFGANSIDIQILEDFVKEGVLAKDQMHYYIAHDIYEEWALNQYIDQQYKLHVEVEDFFIELKNSLPVRRAFRKWLSEKLDAEEYDIIDFISHCFDCKNIHKIWLDEILVSILLSDNSKFFFNSKKDALLKDENQIFTNICSFLRMSCKQVDNTLLKGFDLTNGEISELSFMFTKPKGDGWKQFIDFVFKNLVKIEKSKLKYIIPVLNDWNITNKEGGTTKKAGLIAINIYKEILKENSSSNLIDELLYTIINSVIENKIEVAELIDLAIKHREEEYDNPYRKFVELLLSKMEGWICSVHIPQKIRELAEEFWFEKKVKDASDFRFSSLNDNSPYGMISDNYNYSPASAYQTPIYTLLQKDFLNTVKFIVKITNKAIKKYISNKNYKLITLKIDNKEVKQYLTTNLWLIYRGTQTCPDILTSMHMALEKCLIEKLRDASEDELNKTLKFILSQAKSASITAVVTSVAMAYYEKAFDTIKILVSNKDILLNDNIRFRTEEMTKLQFSQLHGIFRSYNKFIHHKEREESCALPHRKTSLDHVIRYFLFFRNEAVSEELAQSRTSELYKIIDKFYEELEASQTENEESISWKIYLNNIDRRLMQPNLVEQDGKIIIDFNPQISEELKAYQNAHERNLSKKTKHLNLDLWVRYRLDYDEKYKNNNYAIYEDNPLQALEEIIPLWNAIDDDKLDEALSIYRALPSLTCVLLVRDFVELLNQEQLLFCAEIIKCYSADILYPDFHPGVGDGVIEAVNILPKLVNLLEDQNIPIKSLIVVILLKPVQVNMAGTLSTDSLVFNILNYLEKNYEDVLSIYKGYLYFEYKRQSEYEKFKDKKLEENLFERVNHNEFLIEFIKEIEDELDVIESGEIKNIEIKDLSAYSLLALITAFQFSLLNNRIEENIPYTENILEILLPEMLDDKKDDFGNSYQNRWRFFRIYGTYLLEINSPTHLKYLVNKIVEDKNISEGLSKLINELVLCQDRLNRAENFWYIWDALQDKIKFISNNYGFRFNAEKIITSYMFGNTSWKEDANSWPALTSERSYFFKDLTDELGSNYSYIIALIRFVNGIGSIYLEESIYWLSKAIDENANTLSQHRDFVELIAELEILLRKFYLKNKQRIKQIGRLRNAIYKLLDFLIENKSSTGYLLRDELN